MAAFPSPVLRVTFLSLVSVASLIPPVEWGVTATIREARAQEEVRQPTRYAFLFGPSRREFFAGWGWDYDAQRSVRLVRTFDRRVATVQLAIECILAFALAGLADIGWSFTRRRPAGPARNTQ